MKKLITVILIFILAFSYVAPLINDKINSDESYATQAYIDQQAQKKLYAEYERLCELYSQGNYSECVKLCDDWLNSAHSTEYPELMHDVLVKKAAAEYECNELTSALNSCTRAGELFYDSAEIYLLKSKIYRQLGDTENEKAALSAYLQLSGDREVYARLAAIALDAGEYDSAVELYNEYDLNCLSPYDVTDTAIYNRAICYMRLSDYVRAADDFQRCINAGIDSESSRFALAVCNLRLANLPAAKEGFEYCIAHSINAEEAETLLELCN